MKLGDIHLLNGKAETRLVAAFKHYIIPSLQAQNRNDRQDSRTNSRGCLIVSDDTDVFAILLLAECMKGCGVQHVIQYTLHDIDVAHEHLIWIDWMLRGLHSPTRLLGVTSALYSMETPTTCSSRPLFLMSS